jgi:long-chain acyl-CoA synthetase
MSRGSFTVSDIARLGALRFGNAVALEDAGGTIRITYRDLWTRAQAGGGTLRAVGLAPRERVLLMMDGSPDWMVSFLSIVQADLVAVPIPGRMPLALVVAAAAHAGVRACVCDAANRAVAERIPGVRVLTSNDLFTSHAAPPPATTTFDATAVLVFTSGSTSSPRAVALGHHHLLANLRALLSDRGAHSDETLLSVLPPSHAYELVAGQLAPLVAGARIVYAGALLPNRLIAALRIRGITRVLCVPALLEVIGREVVRGLADDGVIEPACCGLTASGLIAALRQQLPSGQAGIRDAVRRLIGPTLRSVVVGGAALSDDWRALLAAADVGVDVGYGLTEAGPLVAVGFGGAYPPGSVGRPLPGVDVRLDARGEILVRSDSLMQGYHNDPDASAATLDNGWLRTGDRGRLDEAGFLFVTGRLKDGIVSANGETVYPDEIEPFYVSPLFAEHCVVPAPGPDGNDIPTLVVVPGSPETSETTLTQAFAALRAAAPGRLRAASMITRREPLPRTVLGKIKRRELAESLGLERVM